MFTIVERYRVVAPSPLVLTEPVPFYGTINIRMIKIAIICNF